jgi:hypothetical protein
MFAASDESRRDVAAILGLDEAALSRAWTDDCAQVSRQPIASVRRFDATPAASAPARQESSAEALLLRQAHKRNHQLQLALIASGERLTKVESELQSLVQSRCEPAHF